MGGLTVLGLGAVTGCGYTSLSRAWHDY